MNERVIPWIAGAVAAITAQMVLIVSLQYQISRASAEIETLKLQVTLLQRQTEKCAYYDPLKLSK